METAPAPLATETPTHYRDFAATITPGHDPNGPDVVATITCDTVDADNEVVLPEGADLSRYVKAPRVMLCHAHGRPGEYYPLPIGKALWTKRQGRALLQGIRFARSSAMGREVAALFREGMLNTFSIGFLSNEASKPTAQEKAIRPDWKDAGLVHRRWTLLEVSVVPIPCNQDAVGEWVGKGRQLPTFLWLPDSTSTKGSSMHVKILRHEDGHWNLYSHEDGRLLGRHTSEQGARDQEQAIQAAQRDRKGLGAHVLIDRSVMGEHSCGIVHSVHAHSQPVVDGDHVDYTGDARPAARLEVHDDEHRATSKHILVKLEHLEPLEKKDESDADMDEKALAESSGAAGGYLVRPHEAAHPGDLGAPEARPEVKAGDLVHWDAHHGVPGGLGRVKSVHRSGKVPDVENEVSADEGNPHARVKRLHRKSHYGIHVKHLTRIPEAPRPGRTEGKAAAPAAPAPAPAPAAPALTPPPYRTRAQVQAGIERRVLEQIDPQAVAEAAAKLAAERVLGAI